MNLLRVAYVSPGSYQVPQTGADKHSDDSNCLDDDGGDGNTNTS